MPRMYKHCCIHVWKVKLPTIETSDLQSGPDKPPEVRGRPDWDWLDLILTCFVQFWEYGKNVAERVR